VPKISINGHQIERVYKKEVLGIVIDDRLSWNRQNEEQCNKISKNINLLRKAKDFVGLDTLKIMYITHWSCLILTTVQLFGKITTKHT
jgi:hypothetical protein